jgi:hypothetical protein
MENCKRMCSHRSVICVFLFAVLNNLNSTALPCRNWTNYRIIEALATQSPNVFYQKKVELVRTRCIRIIGKDSERSYCI